MDHVFDRCWAGDLSIVTSVWNLGEVLGVFDTRRRRGWLSDDEFRRLLRNFVGEVVRLLRLRVLEVIPILISILVEAWPLILREHIYEAEALQIQTCIYSGSDVLLSADKELLNVALRLGIKTVDAEDENKIKELLKHDHTSAGETCDNSLRY